MLQREDTISTQTDWKLQPKLRIQRNFANITIIDTQKKQQKNFTQDTKTTPKELLSTNQDDTSISGTAKDQTRLQQPRQPENSTG